MIDKQRVADTIHTVLDAGLEMLKKDDFSAADHAKLKTIKGMSSFVNAAVMITHQEVAMERIKVIRERMDQLGYKNTPAITQEQ